MIMFPPNSSFTVSVYAATGTGLSYTTYTWGFALHGTRELSDVLCWSIAQQARRGWPKLQHQMPSSHPHLISHAGRHLFIRVLILSPAEDLKSEFRAV